jgi:type I restriction enzyme S subunit
LIPSYSVVLTNRGPIGNVIIPTMDFTTNQGCKSIITTEYNYLMLYYFLSISNGVLNSMGQGTTFLELSTSSLKDFILPTPPLSEQEHIVSYLDDKTNKIDELIQKKLRKIDLLKEYKTSLINTVVTKGLNPNVPMKDSGIEWIGEIPIHWDRVPFKYEIDILTDYTSNGSFKTLSDNVEYLDVGYSRLVRLTDLRVNLENDGIYISEESHNFLSKSELCGGEILISCVGHYTGFVTKMLNNKGKCSLGPNMYLVRNKISTSVTDYLVYLLNSDIIQSGLKNGINKTTQEKINKDNVKDLQIIRPPISEQEQIVSYLDHKTSQIDKTIDIEKKKIELLKEYRQSLISNVVTGKIKVIE